MNQNRNDNAMQQLRITKCVEHNKVSTLEAAMIKLMNTIYHHLVLLYKEIPNLKFLSACQL